MTPAQLSGAVLRSVRAAVAGGELSVAVPERAPLRRPPHPGTGDWATSIALRLAGPAGRPAPEVARVLRARLVREPGVRGVEIRGGGFLNITLSDGADAALVREILARPRPAALPDDPARDIARWAATNGGDPAALLVQREENPLFLVRYAHARSRALERGGMALGVPGADQHGDGDGEGHRYSYPYRAERRLLRALGEGGPLRLVAEALLAAERERPTLPSGDEKPGAVHRARLDLALAAGLVLADGLHRMGVSAPDHL